nr:hypothetical protein [Clostridia bacterium]
MKKFIQVAAHMGNLTLADGTKLPHNTMISYESAYDVGADMIEMDLHMTRDGQIVMIHDTTLDRTTDTSGLIADMTLAEVKKADAGIKFGERFRGARVPEFSEFLELTRRDDKMLFNFEFKDYFKSKVFDDPANDFAKRCADRILSMVEEYGLGDRCVVNSFDGMLLRYIEQKYDGRYKLHGFYPYQINGFDPARPDSRPEKLYCACLFNRSYTADGKSVAGDGPVNPKADFDAVIKDGVRPWVGAGVVTKEQFALCGEYGAELATSNDPAAAMRYLSELGYRG